MAQEESEKDEVYGAAGRFIVAVYLWALIMGPGLSPLYASKLLGFTIAALLSIFSGWLCGSKLGAAATVTGVALALGEMAPFVMIFLFPIVALLGGVSWF